VNSKGRRITHLVVGEIAKETTEAFDKREAKSKDKNWKCGCGSKLPKRGTVWNWRYSKWVARGRPESSGYYCDPCADNREMGIDLEY